MPVYTSKCEDCGNIVEQARPVSLYKEYPRCPACHGATVCAILIPPQGFIKGKFDAFRSTVDGTVISTESELREHNKRNNVKSMSEGFTTEALMEMTTKPRETPKVDKAEVKADIVEAIREVESGYKPLIGAQDE